MPFYEHGDLTNQSGFLRQNLEAAEAYFNRMIECIEQLHSQNIFHRDIKPQNFLVGNGTLVVSDLGLCTQHDSPTAFTRTSVYGGTPGYIPPEFQNGGFRNADAAGDIYMLGVTFLSILSGVESPVLASGLVPGPLLVVIERACAPDKARRYQSLAMLRQSLQLAFDTTLGRSIRGASNILGAQQAIIDRWQTTGSADAEEVGRFVDELAILQPPDQERVCMDIHFEIFQSMASIPMRHGQLSRFLQIYLKMSDSGNYGWSFAETIAQNMAALFNSHLTFAVDKAEAVRIAVVSAIRQNRFAAMDTCRAMIVSAQEAELAQRIFEIMLQHPHSFMESIDPLACRSPVIQRAISILKQETLARLGAAVNPFPL